MFHQICLEVCKLLAHPDALLLAFHECFQSGGNLDVCAQNVVHLLLELGRVSRLAEHANLSWLQSVLQSLIATCSVWIEHIARLLVALLHGLANLFILVGSSANQVGDSMVCSLRSQLSVLAVEVQDACEVRRVAHIHCVGQPVPVLSCGHRH